MTIKLNTILKDYEGKNITEQVQERKEIDGKSSLVINNIPLTVKSVLVQAINNNLPGENRSADDLVMSDGLNVKIYSHDEIELNGSDIEFLQERIVKIWGSPVIFRRMKELFNSIPSFNISSNEKDAN